VINVKIARLVQDGNETYGLIKDGDVFPEREQEITSVIDRVVRQAVGM